VSVDRLAPPRPRKVRPVAPSTERAVTLSVVIPALNEEDGIGAIIERLDSVRTPLAAAGVNGLEIIVVDDGSEDRTAEIAASYPNVRLLRHAANHGYGAAIKTGFSGARGELLAFSDADGTYPPERFPDLCRVALQQDADVVVGSRRSGERTEMPRLRRIGNFVWSTLVSIIGNRRVADPASGMRVLRASALRHLYPLPDGLNFTPVMSTRCVHEKLKVVEVPIAYQERVGRSKLSIVHDGSRFLKTILWTSLEYNPVRVLGLVGVVAFGLAIVFALGIVGLRLQGVTYLDAWGTFLQRVRGRCPGCVRRQHFLAGGHFQLPGVARTRRARARGAIRTPTVQGAAGPALRPTGRCRGGKWAGSRNRQPGAVALGRLGCRASVVVAPG
jgi:glycosyltransferase involved in cell wall biosynthesis